MSMKKRGVTAAVAVVAALTATTVPAGAQTAQSQRLSIADAQITEGNSGRKNLEFTVSLTLPSNRVEFAWITRSGTATAGRDFVPTVGGVRIPNGATSTKISVPIIGDTTVEPDETFTVALYQIERSGITRQVATGTIINDDGAPAATLDSIAVTAPATLVAGLTGQASVQGTYSDGTVKPITGATWSATGGVSVSDTGLVSGVATPSGVVTASFGGKTASATVTVSAATLVSLAVAVTPTSIAKGLTAQATATAKYTDNSTANVSGQVAWTSSAAAATVSSTGLVTGAAQGTANITASLNGVSSNSVAVQVGAATVVSVAIAQSSSTYTTASFTATATYTDNSTSTVAAWTSSDPTVASVDAATGVVTYGKVGTATLTATIGGKSATTTVAVTPRPISSTVTTAIGAAPLAKGRTTQATTKTTSNDGTTATVSGATYSSSNPAVATVDPATGVVTAVAATGSAVITSTYAIPAPAPAGTTLTSTTTVTVGAPVVNSLIITFGPGGFARGENLLVFANALFSDGSYVDVTSLATFTSSDSNIASVVGNKLTAVNVGAANLTVSYLGASFSLPIQVSPAVVTSLNASVPNDTYDGGQLKVIATYSDGTTADVTDAATYAIVSVPNPLASVNTTVSNVAPTKGFITYGRYSTSNPGASTVGITLQGKSTTFLTTVSKRPVGVTRAFDSRKLIVGETAQLQPYGVFSDGNSELIPSGMALSSSNPGVATIDPVTGAVKGQGIGTAVLTVAWSVTDPNGHGSTVFTKTTAVTVVGIQSISMSTPRTTFYGNTVFGVQVVALLTDNTTQDVTSIAASSTDNGGVVVSYDAFYAPGYYPGGFYTENPGQANITVMVGSLSASLPISVVGVCPVSLVDLNCPVYPNPVPTP